MRIVSDFRDYYDSVQGMGQDQSLVYVRKKEEVNCNYPAKYPFPIFPTYRDTSLHIKTHTVGFCGKIYPVIELKKLITVVKNDVAKYDEIVKFCYKLEDVDQYMKENLKDKQLEDYYHKTYRGHGEKVWPWHLRQQSFKLFFDNIEPDKYKNYFEEHKCPLFLGSYSSTGDRTVVYNGALKGVEFFRIFDHYSAFQQIQMYLSNQAVPIKEIPKISDEDMVEIKGFDKKWSFRKEPSKKK